MGETIRGVGLLKADRLLAAIAENPDRLDDERQRFSRGVQSSPYPSQSSTRSQSSEPPSDDRQRQEQKYWQLKEQYYASSPFRQFEVQKEEELSRLFEAEAESTTRQPAGVDLHQLADKNVKERWEVQGIWNRRWETTKEAWRWKHEDSGPTTNTTATAIGTGLFRRPHRRPAKRMRQSSPDERRQELYDSDRDASRPFNQFIHQVLEERERIQSFNGSGVFCDTHDIYTRAYEAIREVWTGRGIWDARWGILPGLSWKHEESLDDVLDRELGGKSDTCQTVVSALSGLRTSGGSSSCAPMPVDSVSNNNKAPAPPRVRSAARTSYRRTEFLRPNLRIPSEARQASPLRQDGLLRRQYADIGLKRGHRLFALDASETKRPNKTAQRRQQKLSHRHGTRSRLADQQNSDNLPYVARLRPRTARGRAQQASSSNGSS